MPVTSYKFTYSDIKRLFNIRQTLHYFDYDDSSTESLKGLLLYCLLSPLYLNCSEGVRFLAFLFELHLDFVDQIHSTIKNQAGTISYCLTSRILYKNYIIIGSIVTIIKLF